MTQPFLFGTATVIVYDAFLGKVIHTNDLFDGVPLFNKQNIAGSGDMIIRRMLTPKVIADISKAILEAENAL
jgi:hypothetical protein